MDAQTLCRGSSPVGAGAPALDTEEAVSEYLWSERVNE